MKINKKRLLALSGFVVVMLAVLVSALAIASDDTTTRPTKLSEVPGFRWSVEDDTIFLWEAFQRAKYVKQCMAEEGYRYSLYTAFLGGNLRAVADFIGAVGTTGSPSSNGIDLVLMPSSPYLKSLTPQQLDGYYLTLFGEENVGEMSYADAIRAAKYHNSLRRKTTVGDVAYVDSTGVLPTGRNDLAQGGCYGAAEALPQIGSTRSFINEDVRREKAIEVAKSAPCITPNGIKLKDLEEREVTFVGVIDNPSISDETKEALYADLDACYEELDRENQAAAARAKTTVFNRHKKRLLDHAEHYRVVTNTIIKDNEFKQHLQTAVAELEDSWDHIDETPPNLD